MGALITPSQEMNIRAAIEAMRALYDDGYIDWWVCGDLDLRDLANALEGMLETYVDCEKAA